MSKLKRITAVILVAALIASVAAIAPFTVSAAEYDNGGAESAVEYSNSDETDLEYGDNAEEVTENDGSVPVGAEYSDEAACAIVSGDFKYEVLGDGTAAITGYTGSAAELTIPAELDGIAVTCIGQGALIGCASVKSIIIPKEITTVGEYAVGFSDNNTKIADFTISGYTGTAAETYAKNNGFKFVDLNAEATLDISSLILGVGETYTFKTEISPLGASTKLTWNSDNSSVVSVDENGKIKAIKTGTANITVKTSNGKTASCKVTVRPAPSSVTVNQTSIVLGVGETCTIAEYSNSGSYANSFSWSSDNTKVAEVEKGSKNKALITGKSTGTANITIKTYNGKTASCKVTVRPAPKSVTVNTTSVTLGVGETYTISELTNSGSYANASNLKWSSSNAKVAAVTKGSKNKAVITAKGVGTADVKIETYNGKTAVCKVTVRKAPTSVTINNKSVTLGKGETLTVSELTNSGSYANASNLKWSSSNTKVATVSKGSANKAKITAKGNGTATITIKTYNGKTASCKVTVKSAPASVTLNKASLNLGKGESYTVYEMTDSISYANASNLKWSSSNTNVATVTKGSENKAKITAKGNGTAKITIKTYNGKTATCTVNVKNMAKSVSLNASSLTMLAGEKYDLDASVPNGYYAYFRTYTSNNTIIAAVDKSSGVVTAKAKGSATITCTLSNGVKTTCKITVVSTSTKKTTTSSTALKQDPKWASKTIANVSRGTTVYQYGKSGNWIKVKYGSNYGWIYNKALGVSRNYSTINTSTLPTVADDILFDTGTSINPIFNYVYNFGYRNAPEDTVENLCVYMLRNGRGACDHHAALLYYLLDRAGYDTLMVHGIDKYTGGGPHVWCMVKTGGKWRHIDATAIIGLNTFYLVTDSTIAPYFSWDRSKYPAAN